MIVRNKLFVTVGLNEYYKSEDHYYKLIKYHYMDYFWNYYLLISEIII